jgi:hypothetical protein
MRRELTIFSCGGNFDIPQSTVTEEQIKALTGHSSGAIACNVSLTWSWAMTQRNHDDLWRDFPKTATGFEARFATEEDCRAYWIEARSGGKWRARAAVRRWCGPIGSRSALSCRWTRL